MWADERHDRGRPVPQALPGEALATVDYVLERYGHLSGTELIRRTHDEKPWREVTEDEDAPPNPTITHEALRDWFEQDPERVSYEAEVERLRCHPAYSFEDRPLTTEQHAAIDRALRGERIQSNEAMLRLNRDLGARMERLASDPEHLFCVITL